MKRRNEMGHFIAGMGMYRYPMLLIAATVAVLTIRKVIDLWVRKDLPPYRLERGLHAILFWGAICAVLGILGQTSGIFNALGAIIKATEISPNIVARGFAESFTTTIFGLEVLVVSAIAWFILYTRYRKLMSS
jgi:hypothetical protein